MKNILFICSRNKLRSPTAETVFCGRDGWDVRSAGLAGDAAVPVSAEDLEWADLVFVMERAHLRKLREQFRKSLKHQRVVCLDIPDEYDYMDEELVRILERKVPR
jgi:predicted protein tyrosine phosphatase